jgi:hypothetical protein
LTYESDNRTCLCKSNPGDPSTTMESYIVRAAIPVEEITNAIGPKNFLPSRKRIQR